MRKKLILRKNAPLIPRNVKFDLTKQWLWVIPVDLIWGYILLLRYMVSDIRHMVSEIKRAAVIYPPPRPKLAWTLVSVQISMFLEQKHLTWCYFISNVLGRDHRGLFKLVPNSSAAIVLPASQLPLFLSDNQLQPFLQKVNFSPCDSSCTTLFVLEDKTIHFHQMKIRICLACCQNSWFLSCYGSRRHKGAELSCRTPTSPDRFNVTLRPQIGFKLWSTTKCKWSRAIINQERIIKPK